MHQEENNRKQPLSELDGGQLLLPGLMLTWGEQSFFWTLTTICLLQGSLQISSSTQSKKNVIPKVLFTPKYINKYKSSKNGFSIRILQSRVTP